MFKPKTMTLLGKYVSSTGIRHFTFEDYIAALVQNEQTYTTFNKIKIHKHPV